MDERDVILSERGPKRFLKFGGGERRICFCFFCPLPTAHVEQIPPSARNIFRSAKEKARMSTAPYPNVETVFYQQYEAVRRDEVVGVLLALFLGGFGAHHFYLRRIGLGILYLCFSWTGIPWIFGFIECFFMPGRVREFNAIQAAGIASALGIGLPQNWGYPPVNVNVYTQQPAAGATAPASTLAVSPAAVSTLVACPRCRTTNPAGSRFCGSCGNAL
jgi:TM2 domain-containing membrane protein YozV